MSDELYVSVIEDTAQAGPGPWFDIEEFERAQYPGSQDPTTCLHVAAERLQIGINTTLPKAPIHIVIGEDEFTDEDVREWAKGNLKGIDWTAAAFLIEYLSQIIVNQVLDPASCNS